MAILEESLADDDGLLRDLAELGVSRNEARLYLAALGQPALRASEIAELAGIGRTKAYDALRLLVERGLVTEEPGPPARFKAVDAPLAVQRLRAQALVDQTDLVEDTRLLAAGLFNRYYAAPEDQDPFDFVELLRNCEAARARREAVTAGAHFEVLRARMLPPPGVRPPVEDEAGLRPGVGYRSLYEWGFLDDADFVAGLGRREGQGEQARFTDRVPVGLCIVDRRLCVISLNPTGVVSGPGTWLVLEDAGLGGLLTEMFLAAWAAGQPRPGVQPAAGEP
jgi:hypothetical protein